MSLSRKYGRTFHYPFSPGTTSDDRINHDYWQDLGEIKKVVHTEKLDGENTCLNRYGVFARSHASPTIHPWANYLKERWNSFKNDLGEVEIFGENIYAIHSIQYAEIEHHFYVFGVRVLDQWLSWEEIEFYAGLLDFPTVPVLGEGIVEEHREQSFKEEVLTITQAPSTFQSTDVITEESCSMEGIVTRNVEAYTVDDFKRNVFKFVRKDHVKTDQHWSRNWKRAPLKWER